MNNKLFKLFKTHCKLISSRMIQEEVQFLVCGVRKVQMIHNLRLLFALASITDLSSEEICGDYEEIAATGAIHLQS